MSRCDLVDDVHLHSWIFGQSIGIRRATMTTLMQDVQYALRQLRKTPGFTITVLLTLALGIGANAAIFSLVNAVLLKRLPVADPKMLVRIGNNDDCCVTGGTKDSGNYGLFSTDTYQQLKKNLPEFEELAGIQAGFHYRPVTVRRDGTGIEPKSVMGEFVSGNYFRTFGLKAPAGRLLGDADDLRSAPATAVMSYDTWQRDYAGDSSVIGSTFWVNTKAVTVVGIAPQGFYGDRMSNTPPDYYLPIESMPVLANVAYVHEPNSSWLYIVGRLKSGVALPPLQDKVNALLKQILAHRFTQSKHDQEVLAKTHATLTPGGAGIQALQDEYASHLRLLM
jgi:macrolide transport system ATP-binding/permease protein